MEVSSNFGVPVPNSQPSAIALRSGMSWPPLRKLGITLGLLGLASAPFCHLFVLSLHCSKLDDRC